MRAIAEIEIVSTPDCSLYRDMPFIWQLTNISISRALGVYLQEEKYVIPNVRWGDERTYTRRVLGFAPAFVGIPSGSVVSIGTYGCSKTREDKYYLEAGLDAMLEELHPTHVVVYGSFNEKLFGKYDRYTVFHVIRD